MTAADYQAAVAGGLSFEAQLGEIHAAVTRVSDQLSRQAERQRRMQRAIHALPMPSVQFAVVSSNLAVPTAALLAGPEDGQVWDIRLVTLAGWTSADAAIAVNLYSELNTGQSALQGNPQNRLAQFNNSAAGNERWAPGGGLVLHSPESLILQGGPFTTTTAITMNLRGVAFEQWIEPDYLL